MSSRPTPPTSDKSHVAPSPKNIERMLRLGDFLQDKETPSKQRHKAAVQTPKSKTTEKDLDVFMGSVTDATLVKNAKADWERKTPCEKLPKSEGTGNKY